VSTAAVWQGVEGLEGNAPVDGAARRESGRVRVKPLDGFLRDVERRALVIAELATRDREEALDLVQDTMLPSSTATRIMMRQSGRRCSTACCRTHPRLAPAPAVRRRWRVWLNRDDEDELDPIETAPDRTRERPSRKSRWRGRAKP